VARKLAVLHYLWNTGEVYEALHIQKSMNTFEIMSRRVAMVSVLGSSCGFLGYLRSDAIHGHIDPSGVAEGFSYIW
jgi:hypothetical protein